MHIMRFTAEDLAREMDAFCGLYTTVFTAPANREIISQRYLGNPSGELLMVVAQDQGKIVANYSAVPIEVTVDGEPRKAALSLNTMTDPAYAGRGLFTTLAGALYEDLAAAGYALIIGFPNYLSNRTFNMRLGWRTIYEIPTLKLNLEDVRETVVSAEPDSGTFENLRPNDGISRVHVRLSPEYLAWRFRDNREKRYRVLAADESNWLIYQFYRKEINITELCYRDAALRDALVDRVIAMGKREGFEAVTLWCTANTETHSALEKKGFRLSAPIRNFGARCFDPALAETVYDWRNWFVQMGDDNTY